MISFIKDQKYSEHVKGKFLEHFVNFQIPLNLNEERDWEFVRGLFEYLQDELL